MLPYRHIIISAASIFFLILVSSCHHSEVKTFDSWQTYGGALNLHYSSLSQIDTENVNQLKVAWTYQAGDAEKMTQIQVNPIIIDTILYGVSPKLKLFALNASTGKSLWSFDPLDTTSKANKGAGFFLMNICRGISYYNNGPNDQRIFFMATSRLYSIDAKTGKPDEVFGKNGYIDLHDDLGRDVHELYVAGTTPGVIYKDMIIVGDRVAEEAAAAPGHIRAYDVHTGKIRWIFHTIPQPGENGYDTWEDKEAYKHIGGANCWSGFSLDPEKGILFAPTGSSSYDFYGGKRKGQNLYSNCLIAINASNGKRIWHFQTVHHDIWDKDLPAPPALVTIHKEGKTIEAVAQISKTGFIFLFNRQTGEPVYPIIETPVPSVSELAGEEPMLTQPIPVFPQPFARQTLMEKDLNDLVPDSSYQDIKKRLSTYKTGNMYNPPSKEGTVIFPGFDGGGEWGGPAYDPLTGILYVNANEMPWVLTMIDVKDKPKVSESMLEAGKRIYLANCLGCHGAERNGSGNYPSLSHVDIKYNEDQFLQLINSGRRMMPSFKQLKEGEKAALATYILDIRSRQRKAYIDSGGIEDSYWKLPYVASGYNKFLTKEGYPAVKPPWGTLTAIDLNTGKVAWKDTLGDYPEFKSKGIHTGTENYGGPVVTAGGLLFIAATRDQKFRAYNKRTGALLWETELPACGFATPSVYSINGKQYIVIACGGGKLNTSSGDKYVAFSLP